MPFNNLYHFIYVLQRQQGRLHSYAPGSVAQGLMCNTSLLTSTEASTYVIVSYTCYYVDLLVWHVFLV